MILVFVWFPGGQIVNLNKDKWTFSTKHPDTSKNGATFAMGASREYGNKFVVV